MNRYTIWRCVCKAPTVKSSSSGECWFTWEFMENIRSRYTQNHKHSHLSFGRILNCKTFLQIRIGCCYLSFSCLTISRSYVLWSVLVWKWVFRLGRLNCEDNFDLYLFCENVKTLLIERNYSLLGTFSGSEMIWEINFSGGITFIDN